MPCPTLNNWLWWYPAFASFVVAQSGLHVRENLAQRFERERVKLVETNVEQRVRHCGFVGQRQPAKSGRHFVVVFVNAEHPAKIVEQW